jgi:hypothetical protein
MHLLLFSINIYANITGLISKSYGYKYSQSFFDANAKYDNKKINLIKIKALKFKISAY